MWLGRQTVSSIEIDVSFIQSVLYREVPLQFVKLPHLSDKENDLQYMAGWRFVHKKVGNRDEDGSDTTKNVMRKA